MRVEAEMQNDLVVTHPAEDIGLIMETDRVFIPYKGGTVTIGPSPATYEQLLYLCESGIKKVGTGVADGAGSGKIYAYPFPTTTPKPAIQSFSVQYGDDQQMELASFAICESFKLSGAVMKEILMQATLKTRAVAPNSYTAATISFDNLHHISDSANGLAIFPVGAKIAVTGTASNNSTFTVTVSSAAQLTVTETTVTEAAGPSDTIAQTFDALTVPSVNTILFQQAKLYVDPVSGTVGSTQQSNTMLSFELNYTTGWKGQPAADGRLDFSFAKLTKPTGTLKITYQHDGSATAEKANWINGTPRYIRVAILGKALVTAGVYTNYTLYIDLLGYWTKFSSLKNDNGGDTVDAEFAFGYDSTAGSSGQILVVNETASLT